MFGYRIAFSVARRLDLSRPRDAGFQFPHSLSPIIQTFPFIKTAIMTFQKSGGYLLSQFFPGMVCFRCIELCTGFPVSPEP